MACQTCRHARHLARSLRSSTDRHLSSSSFSTYSRPVTASAALPTRRRHLTHSAHHRGISGSSTSRPTSRSSAPSNAATTETPSDAPPAGSASAALRNVGSRLAAYQAISSPYALTSSLDKLYKRCASPAAYTISEELRKKDEVPKTAEGEELGTPEGPWLEIFNLSPSFSSWSHVTMLHMYLIIARMRCLERDDAKAMQAQFVDNFFFDCERVMHLNHGMASSALRQRYLKDIFMQWRGLIAAYDEGLAKGSDRVLAAAVWRNLFKAREDVDFRALAAIVVWIRLSLKDIEAMDIETLITAPNLVFRRDPRGMFSLVDKPCDELKTLYDGLSRTTGKGGGDGGAGAGAGAGGVGDQAKRVEGTG